MPKGVYARTVATRAILSAAQKASSRSVACLAKVNAAKVRHGHTRRRTSSPTFRTWNGMVQRCTNPNATGYAYWGGRGITVCDRWRVFENFLVDMGVRPVGRILDRRDNDGNYEPGNCRWATPKESANNRRKA